jgi:hypothetical protein
LASCAALNKLSPDEVEGGLAIIADNIVPVTLYTETRVEGRHGLRRQRRRRVDDRRALRGAVPAAASRPDKPLMVKTLIVPTPEYQEGRNVILTTGRSVTRSCSGT